MPNQYDQQVIGYEQQRKTAQALRELGMQPTEGQMVSGRYVAPSSTQYLAKILQLYMGNKREKEASKNIETATANKQAKISELLRGMNAPVTEQAGSAPIDSQALLRGAGVTAEVPGGEYLKQAGIQPYHQPIGQQPITSNRQMTQEERLPIIAELSQYDPTAAAMMNAHYEGAATRADNAANRMSERQMMLDAQRLTNQEKSAESEALRREKYAADEKARREGYAQQENMARLIAGLRPPPQEKMISIADSSGNPVLIPQSQAQGATPFNAQTAKIVPQMKQAEVSIQQSLDKAADVYAHPGKASGTGWTAFAQNIPATDAKAFGGQLNQLKSQGFLAAVEQMRGLGALTEAEGKKLTDSIGALDPYQAKSDFDKGLADVANTLYERGKAKGLNLTLPEFARPKKNIGNAPSGGVIRYDSNGNRI